MLCTLLLAYDVRCVDFCRLSIQLHRHDRRLRLILDSGLEHRSPVTGLSLLVATSAGSLQQVMCVKLESGHFHTALMAASLPCTSHGADAAGASMPLAPAQSSAAVTVGGIAAGGSGGEGTGAGRGPQPPGCKEFIVLCSYVLYEDGEAALSGGQHTAGAPRPEAGQRKLLPAARFYP